MAVFTIVGAGPVGTLLAVLLARRGHAVRVFERRPDPRRVAPERGRSINLALAARGLTALGHAGVLADVQALLMPMPGRMLHLEDGSQQFLPYSENAHELIYAAGREPLNRVLIESAARLPQIEWHFDTRCVDVDPGAGVMRVRSGSDGRERSEGFEVLIGADGAGSAVRGALAARGLTRVQEMPLDHDYKELMLPPAFDPRALHIWPRGGYMLIALPNTDLTFTATLFLPRRGPVSFEHLGEDAAVLRLFQEQFADAGAVLPDLLAQFAAHPQSHLGTLHCEPWHVDGRVLLIGDAAHAIVPFHGQGLNCGFEDCRVLDGLMAGIEPGAAFARFERERRADTAAIAQMALENYEEMRDTVRSAAFARRQALAADLERRFPGRFIPRYSMVMFHPEIPYSEARRRGLAQEQVLDALSSGPQTQPAGALLDRAGL